MQTDKTGWAEWGEPGDITSSYRYALGRVLGSSPEICCFVGLNPSTATAEEDDPTIRRCCGYARSFGCGQLVMVNLFAWRATDPKGLRRCADAGLDPIGPLNDAHVSRHARSAAMVVAAWGDGGRLLGRGEQVRRMLHDAGIALHVLAVTQNGSPGHPLYLQRSLMPRLWVID